jgi:hypothetical protein
VSPEELAALARSAAAFHRLGMLGQGGEALAQLVDGLLVLLADEAELAAALAPLLGEIVAAQQRGDWIGVADALEHQLAPALVG